MILKELSVVNFKNFKGVEVSLNSKINCFVGNNGQGKTTLLDAIYYLSFCKSFLNPIDSQNINRFENFFILQGQYDRDGKTERVHCGLKKGQKKSFKRNKDDIININKAIFWSESATARISDIKKSALKKIFLNGFKGPKIYINK